MITLELRRGLLNSRKAKASNSSRGSSGGTGYESHFWSRFGSSDHGPTWAFLVLVCLMTVIIYIKQSPNDVAIDLSTQTQQLSLRSHLLPSDWCDRHQQRPPVALLMLIVGFDNATRHDPYWMAVANRRAYAIEHGYTLYLVSQQLGSGQHAAWEKLIAVQAVFTHSCAEWVWMSDADAYIMNLQLDIMALARRPKLHRNPKKLCSSNQPDVTVAGSCMTHINTGSTLLRNTPWTQQLVSDAWHSKFIARPANWWDQAAILHMYKQGNTKDHFCIVKQHAMNALPPGNNCHDGFGTYKDGDLLVHFPGGMKQHIASMDSKWLQSAPILTSSLDRVSSRASIFVISGFNQTLHPLLSEGHAVHVSLQSSRYGLLSDMGTDFDVWIEPQSAEDVFNWGWPISPVPAELKALVRKQLAGSRTV